MLELFKRAWLTWNGMARGILGAQNAVLMTAAYLIGVGPVAVGMKLLGRDPIERVGPDASAPSYWRRRDGKPIDMRGATRQF